MSELQEMRRRAERQAKILQRMINSSLPPECVLSEIIAGIDSEKVPSGRISIAQTHRSDGALLNEPEVSSLTLSLSDPITVRIKGAGKSKEIARTIEANHLTGLMSLTIMASEMSRMQ